MNDRLESSDYEVPEETIFTLVGDKEGNFVYANPAFLEVSGYSWDEIKGTLAAKMVHADTPKQVMKDMAATLRRRQPWCGVTRNQRKNGQRYWLRLNIMPLWADGKFAGSLMVHSSVSREELGRIAQLYKQLREGTDRTLTVRSGRVMRATAWGKLVEALRSLGLNSHIWGSIAAINLAALLCGLLVAAQAGMLPVLAVAGAAFAAFSVVVGWYLSRLVVRPLREAVALANQAAACDLGKRMSSTRRDEVGDMVRVLDQMTMNMRTTVMDVRDCANLVQRAASEIAVGTSHMSNHTEAQASSLEETAASMEEMTTTVQHNAVAAREATQFAASAALAAEAGGKVVDELISTMDVIAHSSKKIAEINGIIDGIAFQTNILALNAAVEAARAGEQGRGFAVVAAEVRSLAQRSAQAAQEVRGLIKNSVSSVEKGGVLANNAGSAMDGIVSQIKSVTDQISHIASASVEQSSGIGQINQAVAHLDQMTQRNAALVEENTSAAQSLAMHAQTLVAAVSVFKLSKAENQQLASRSGLRALSAPRLRTLPGS